LSITCRKRLASNVAHAERRPERIRDELLAQFRAERIEPPTAGRVLRMVRSALRTAEQSWALRISERLDPTVTARLLNLLVDESDEDDPGTLAESVLGLIKSAPGNVSLDSMMVEIAKLEAVRAVGLPADLFADVVPKVLDGWRARAVVEAPSHLRRHAQPLTVTLLAALVHRREREITDTLVDLLIATVHRIGPRRAAGDQRADQRLQGGHRQGEVERGCTTVGRRVPMAWMTMPALSRAVLHTVRVERGKW